jgi:hypothetical protein
LYNPQLVFVHVQKVLTGGSALLHLDEANATHSASAIAAVAETGPVTVHDLMELLAQRRVASRILPELSYLELMRGDRSAELTWSLLYYLGVVTHHQEANRLCIPNTAMQVLVSKDVSLIERC